MNNVLMYPINYSWRIYEKSVFCVPLSITYSTLERTPCVVHTLQLVVNMIQKEPTIKWLLDKARRLVKLFHKSSIATERLLQQCRLILIKDCPNRWSSSYLMIYRVLEVKDHLTSVANTMNWDGLLPSEWQKVAILRDLLLPFSEHTKVLESDTNSPSLVMPALLDSSVWVLRSSCQEPQGSSYTGTEDECKYGATLQLFPWCHGHQVLSSCCSCMFRWPQCISWSPYWKWGWGNSESSKEGRRPHHSQFATKTASARGGEWWWREKWGYRGFRHDPFANAKMA